MTTDALALPTATVTIPRLGTDTKGGEATVSVALVIDGERYEGTARLEGKTSAPYTKTVLLQQVEQAS